MFYCLAIFLLLGCAHSSSLKELTPGMPKQIIDAHTHWDRGESGKSFNHQPTDKMKQEFKDNNVVGAVVHSSRRDPAGIEIDSQSGIRFSICASVTPPLTTSQLEKDLLKKKFQCMKIYLAYVPKYASDPYYQPFYKLAEKYNVPVVFHTGDPYDKMAKVKYADPLTLDEIAVTYPKIKFVLAHIGNPWVQSAAEVVYKNDNVYADVSALMLGDLSKNNPESVEELVVRPIRWFFLYTENPKKILFGSDWPLVSIGPYIQAVQRAIPKEHWEAVFYKNAAELFQIQ